VETVNECLLLAVRDSLDPSHRQAWSRPGSAAPAPPCLRPPASGRGTWLTEQATALVRRADQVDLMCRALSNAVQTTGHADAAPRGALLYPRRSREELEGRFLGLMAYLDGKPEGNNSMPGK